MIEQFAGEELQVFKFPRLYVDHVANRLPFSFDVPEYFDRTRKEELERETKSAEENPFWNEILEYNARLGASRASLNGIEALSSGTAVPVVTGQQPGLLGGPLYTLYKILTAASLSELLFQDKTRSVSASRTGALRAVPVFWNASDDSDFSEVSSATFFGRDLSLTKFSVDALHHARGEMVGSTSIEALNGPIETLMLAFEKSPNITFVMSCLEDCLSAARDWGEFFSAMVLRLFSTAGIVVVDARIPSIARGSRRVMDAYLSKAGSVEVSVADRLGEFKKHGYGEPVSPLSGETCVFVRDGVARRKVSRAELPAIADLWGGGKVELLPNVLLGPVVRDELMRPVATVVGPSEASYYIVAGALYEVLGFTRRPIFPRLSLTIVPEALTYLVDGHPNRYKELVVSFEKVARSHFENHLPVDVAKELAVSKNEMRSAIEKLTRLAAVAGKGTEEVTASAARKIDFELERIREEFVAVSKRKLMSENPMLRRAGEFLLPAGALQERSLCSLAPLVYGGEPLIEALRELARTGVLECLEGRVRHYVASVTIP